MHPILVRHRKRIQIKQARRALFTNYGNIFLGVVVAIAYWSLLIAAHNSA